MCLGIPMQIIAYQGGMAVCEAQGERRLIDMMLLGEMAIGSWVLTFLDTAREALTEEQALEISNALQAVQLAMQGETNIDHLFADLLDREPRLPEFLTEQES